MRRTALASTGTVLGALVLGAYPAHADPSSGVDSVLFRPSYDTTGVFSLEGGQTLPSRDVVWKFLAGYAQQPFTAPVPGIGDSGKDAILKYAATFDFTFALALTGKLTIAMDAAGYRAAPDAGYGIRGRYNVDPTAQSAKSTGIISLRALDSFDPSQSSAYDPNNLPQEHAGPLDVRVAAKYGLFAGPKLSGSLVLSASLPFGEDEMFVGDSGVVVEPKLAFDYRPDRIHATKLVANLGARLRRRTVLEAYDPATQTQDMAQVVMDVGSEGMVGLGAAWELSPRVVLGVEDMLFIPLPSGLTYGDCRRFSGVKCSTITSSDYFAGGGAGDLASYAMAGLTIRANASVGVQLMGGLGWLGERGDAFHVSAGVVWSPQPAGAGDLGRGDRDGDGIPDNLDGCPDEPEDKDGYQDEDGCPDLDNDGDGVADINDSCPNEPEDKDSYQDDDGCPDRDNDGDGIPDVTDKCPNDKEDFDGFQDDDGCPEDDNDGDGFPDNADKCPNDPETVNGVDDDDGCPDTRTSTGPEEISDRINLKGNRIDFQSAQSDKLSSATKQILNQVAALIKDRNLSIRIEVHVPLSTRSKNAGQIAAARRKDKELSNRRGQAIFSYLVSQGVDPKLLQNGAIGLGSERPLGNNPPDDPLNERVDFIKAQQQRQP